MIQNWVNPWIRDGQILRSSRSRSSRSSRSGHDQIQIIRSRPRIPRIDTPNGSILDPLFDTPDRPCHDMSGIVTNGPIVVWNMGLWPLGHSPLIPCHHMVWNPVRTSQKWSKKGYQTRSHGGFRPPGEKWPPYIYTVARARRGFPRENDPFLTTFGPLRTPFGRVSP